MEIARRYSVTARRMSRSIIRELLKLTDKPGLISFAGGLPSPKAFPTREIDMICRDLLSRTPETALQYSVTEGLSGLRDVLVSFLAENGLHVR
ncbi:unnamed protein product, partial [marine sediment metagenome]